MLHLPVSVQTEQKIYGIPDLRCRIGVIRKESARGTVAAFIKMGREHNDRLFGCDGHCILPVVALLQVLITFGIGNGGDDVAFKQGIVCRVFQNQILLHLAEKLRSIRHRRLPSSGTGGSRSAFLLQHLDGFRQDGFAVQTFGGKESDLTVTRIQFVQPSERNALAVADPVIAQVAEDDGFCTGSDFGGVFGGEVGPAENGADLAVFQRRLQEIVAVGIFEFADDLDGAVVENPYGILTVGCFETVIEVNQFICGNGGGSCSRNSDLSFRRSC